MDYKAKILILVILVAALFVIEIIEPDVDNNISFSEFLENLELGNVKNRLIIDRDVIYFEPIRSRIELKGGMREYDKIRYSVSIPESEWLKLKRTLEEKGFYFEISDF